MMLRSCRVLLCEAVPKVSFKRSPHEILGVDRMSTADEVRTKYLQLITEHHPDKGGDAEKFQSIREAYEKVLEGAPGHMKYGRLDEAPPFEYQVRDRITEYLKKRNITVHWERMNDEYRATDYWSVVMKRIAIAGFAYWAIYLCTPAQPQYLIYFAGAYAIDYVTGYRFLFFSLPFFVWFSIISGKFPAFYTAVGSYWAFDRPNSQTVALGIPNYYDREAMREWKYASKAHVGRASTAKGYSHVVDHVEEEPTARPPMSAAERQALLVDERNASAA